jgi:hypothetical protein
VPSLRVQDVQDHLGPNFTFHTGGVRAVALSPSYMFLASASEAIIVLDDWFRTLRGHGR